MLCSWLSDEMMPFPCYSLKSFTIYERPGLAIVIKEMIGCIQRPMDCRLIDFYAL